MLESHLDLYCVLERMIVAAQEKNFSELDRLNSLYSRTAKKVISITFTSLDFDYLNCRSECLRLEGSKNKLDYREKATTVEKIFNSLPIPDLITSN